MLLVHPIYRFSGLFIFEIKTIINITINELANVAYSDDEIWAASSGCSGYSTKKFLGTLGAVLGIVGGIITIL